MITKPKGTIDFLPQQSFRRLFIENELRKFASIFNFLEIRTPTFEKTELFRRGIGENTDIVSKEMYSFNNNEFTLKPEMTAPVIRAYIENSLFNVSAVQKLYYISNMFRHERPQAGRFREFSQFGAEIIGSNDYTADVELISLGAYILKKFGIENIKIKINNIGTLEERVIYLRDLKKYLLNYYERLSGESKKRFEINPLRILDSKDVNDKEIIKNAPILYDYLSEENKNHFNNVLTTLSSINIDYEIDYMLVRGLDYYTSTTFEIISEDLGAQNAILGGGRYDRLTEHLGGKSTPAIGFACGLERLTMVLESSAFVFPDFPSPSVYIITLDDKSKAFSQNLIYELRKNNISVETDLFGRSLKSQMKDANRLNAKYVVVLGDNEINTGIAKIKNMRESFEIEIKLSELINFKF